mmetsp:Transcript_50239/g.98937  ORF Transcript_50239/g.98937 Transcript_50239/m.98937 type:complete len:81 (-) Transcript_50239:43-285(-)
MASLSIMSGDISLWSTALNDVTRVGVLSNREGVKAVLSTAEERNARDLQIIFRPQEQRRAGEIRAVSAETVYARPQSTTT